MIESRNVCRMDLLWEEIRSIESLTPVEVASILGKAGMTRNSKDWHDYEKAKGIIFQGHWINSEIYSEHIEAITNYLGL